MTLLALTQVLMLTHSAGYEHDVIRRPNPSTLSLAEASLVQAAAGEIEIHATKDAGRINAKELNNFKAVVFYTTGDLPIHDEDKQALLDFIRDGGGFAGIHPATDTFYSWPDYGEMIGGWFAGHPWHQEVKIRVEDPTHPAVRHLGQSFTITDEIYQFRSFSRDQVHVLMSLQNDSVDISLGGRADRDYALAWLRDFGHGRVFYTALGHRAEVWRDERFLRHVLAGISWVMHREAQAEAAPDAPVRRR